MKEGSTRGTKMKLKSEINLSPIKYQFEESNQGHGLINRARLMDIEKKRHDTANIMTYKTS